MAPRSLIVILGLVLLVTCASVIPKLLSKDAERGRTLYPDLTLEQLTSGRKVYINHCGSCHALYVPSKFSKEAWDRHLLPMARLVKLDSTSTSDMVRYIHVAIMHDSVQPQN